MKPAHLTACLLGGALGDSLGLPFEGMTADRIRALWGKGGLRQRLILGHGMLSDDTEHAAATALSLKACDGDPDRFARDLARRLRWWFAGIPAGIGMATARSILKLWFGVSPAKSGVFSAGNGPLMRAAVIGVHFSGDPAKRQAFSEASTRITHRDPRAAECARLIAEAAAFACFPEGDILVILGKLAVSEEMTYRLTALREALNTRESVSTFADRIGRRSGYVSGFAPDSAAVALYAWLRHRGDFSGTLEAVIRAGGDTDTVAFVAGSLAGIDAGTAGLPESHLSRLKDWPLSVPALRRIGDGGKISYPLWPATLLRNGVFLTIVLGHGFRRLLPPYRSMNSSSSTRLDRSLGCLVGLAAGDALGTTLEFKDPGTFAPLTDMIGGGPFRLKAGEWTDDTSMALCLAESLLERQGFDLRDQIERYTRWANQGHLSSNGICFDIGNTVSSALWAYRRTGNPAAGSDDPFSAGNGSIMRLAPVPIFYQNPVEAIRHSRESSRTTHQAASCLDACAYLGGILSGLLGGASKEEVLSPFFRPGGIPWQAGELDPAIAEIAAGSFKTRQPPEIEGTGYVVKSLEAALWAFHHSTTFEEGALLAVNLGDDADTTGAIYGQIAGAYYGIHGILECWVQKLALRDLIFDYATRLNLGPQSS